MMFSKNLFLFLFYVFFVFFITEKMVTKCVLGVPYFSKQKNSFQNPLPNRPILILFLLFNI